MIAPDDVSPLPSIGNSRDADPSPTSRARERLYSRVQIEAFKRTVTGGDGGPAPATLAALERRGLITLREMLLPGEFAMRVKIPVVPLPVHYAWCAWCAERPDPDLGWGKLLVAISTC